MRVKLRRLRCEFHMEDDTKYLPGSALVQTLMTLTGRVVCAAYWSGYGLLYVFEFLRVW